MEVMAARLEKPVVIAKGELRNLQSFFAILVS